MEKKYRDAVFTGLKCGAVIVGLNIICDIVSMLPNFTPATKSYLMNHHTFPDSGQFPTEFHIIAILAIVQLATLVIGFLVTGLLAIRSGERRKNTVNHIVTIGAIAGIAAFILFLVVGTIWNVATMGATLNPMTPGNPDISDKTISGQGLGLGCCLTQGIILSAILSAIGAWGYAYFTKGIRYLS